MRVLIVHPFHYLRGGVERCALDESRWLAAAGHEVAHLAIRDPRNLPSPTAEWFAPHVEYGEGAGALRQLAQLPHAIWSLPAERCAEALIAHWRPDVAHVHAPSRYLTPAVLRPLERARIPMVMTLHDFKPWCTNRTLFARGEPCTRCQGGRHWHAFAIGCVQDSRVKSAIGSLEAYVHDAIGAYRGIARWIAPSRFVREMAIELGLDATRVREIAHGLEPAAVLEATAAPGPDASPPYALFAGRLSVEKGVRLLPAIALRLAPTRLLVAGEGPLGPWLDDRARDLPNLERLGQLGSEALTRITAGAGAVLVPSLSYETFCFAAAEAQLAARPVVAARIGAIPELVEHEASGLLAPPGDAAALADATRRALQDRDAARWAAEGRRRVLERTDPVGHRAALLETYRDAGATG